MNKVIKNIAFEGGGAKGIAHLGAMKALNELKIFDDINHVAGTSAGAIAACLFSVGYSYDDIYEILYPLDMETLLEYPPSFIENPGFNDSISKFIFEAFINRDSAEHKYCMMILNALLYQNGICTGELFYNWLKEVISNSPVAKKSGLDGKITFKQLAIHGGKDLHVFTSETFKSQILECSADTTPDLEVALAVRASMSIPVYFEPVIIPGIADMETDGGMFNNLPITFMDAKGDGDQTLGISLNPNKATGDGPTEFGFSSFFSEVKQLVNDVMNVQVARYHTDPLLNDRIAYIDTGDVGTFSFNMTQVQKDLCISNGYDSVMKFLIEPIN
ncbi:hypothetical protein SMQE32_47760 (plasmid) [Serratia marcescens]|nr:hypothetical protein SMQE01_46040 [Serratia marcescens]BEO54806.1 hypothetical protein SMQE21_47460 [Serratia marcescens]BEO73957.1 hypothetical protein SMQE32_47760 [Serratia marcescens]